MALMTFSQKSILPQLPECKKLIGCAKYNIAFIRAVFKSYLLFFDLGI